MMPVGWMQKVFIWKFALQELLSQMRVSISKPQHFGAIERPFVAAGSDKADRWDWTYFELLVSWEYSRIRVLSTSPIELASGRADIEPPMIIQN
jgi:hypothetical protein